MKTRMTEVGGAVVVLKHIGSMSMPKQFFVLHFTVKLFVIYVYTGLPFRSKICKSKTAKSLKLEVKQHKNGKRSVTFWKS